MGCLMLVLVALLVLLILSWLFGGFQLGHKAAGPAAASAVGVVAVLAVPPG
jgi:hypothetical protein